MHPWREVAGVFLRLGITAFGGPVAHIAMMRTELVRRRRWLDDDEFMDLVGATNLVPGPNSTELAIHLGLRRAGWRGFTVAAAGFIVPAAMIVLGLAVLYERYGTTPVALDLSYGVLPVIVAIIAHACVGLGRTAVKGVATGAVGMLVAALWFAGVNELVLLFGAALVGAARVAARRSAALSVSGLLAAAAVEPGLWRLGATFFKIGAVLYGSGYVLVSFLERDVVDRFGWLTERQLLDAVAIGQITPGPVFTTATFVGYQAAGVLGALVATLAIFAPAFVFVALLSRIVPRLRASATARGVLDMVNAASLGLMAAALVRLSGAALVDPLTVAVAAASLGVLWWKTPNTAWLVACGAAIGLLDGAVG